MKYWRGYLTAAILGFFSWALMQFAKTHTQLIDMVYPYVTRMIQSTLAEWSGGTDYILWQVLLVLAAVLLLVTVVMMILLRWNPIQWFGWVLAAASVVGLLHVGIYGLNDYAGPLADDIKLTTSDYVILELEEAAAYYRDRANVLADLVSRDRSGDVDFADFDTLAEMTTDGFQQLTYAEHWAVFYGTTVNNEDYTHWSNWQPLSIKKLTWTEWYTSVGVTAVYVPLTGEVAVNPETPAVALPFIMCREAAKRLCIARDGDAEFAAYLACDANSSLAFQYSAQFMAYRSFKEALATTPGSAASQALARLEAQEGQNLRHDLEQYDSFFTDNASQENLELLEKIDTLLSDLDYNIRDLFGVEPLTVDGDSFYDLLVNWHIQKVVLPTQIPEEEEVKFDPYNEDYINGVTDMEGNLIVEDTQPTEETTGE